MSARDEINEQLRGNARERDTVRQQAKTARNRLIAASSFADENDLAAIDPAALLRAQTEFNECVWKMKALLKRRQELAAEIM